MLVFVVFTILESASSHFQLVWLAPTCYFQVGGKLLEKSTYISAYYTARALDVSRVFHSTPFQFLPSIKAFNSICYGARWILGFFAEIVPVKIFSSSFSRLKSFSNSFLNIPTAFKRGYIAGLYESHDMATELCFQFFFVPFVAVAAAFIILSVWLYFHYLPWAFYIRRKANYWKEMCSVHRKGKESTSTISSFMSHPRMSMPKQLNDVSPPPP